MTFIHVLAILGLLTFLALTVRASITLEKDKFDRSKVKKIDLFALITALILVIIGFNALGAIVQVPNGHRGVVLRFGGTTGRILPEGLNATFPFIESTDLMNVQIQAHKTVSGAASRDLQDVATEVTLNYHLQPDAVAHMYKTLGRSYVNRIVEPTIHEVVKAVTANYDAEELITKRMAVKAAIEAAITERLAKYDLILDQMSITNFKFSDAFSDAIEAKQVATQKALKAQNEVVEAKAHADAAIATARGTAEAIRIQAEAIRAQGGSEYVQLQAIAKWNGSLPTFMAPNAPMPFLNLK